MKARYRQLCAVAAAGGLFCALWWASGRERRWVRTAGTRPHLAPVVVPLPPRWDGVCPIEGHECAFEEWEDPAAPWPVTWAAERR